MDSLQGGPGSAIEERDNEFGRSMATMGSDSPSHGSIGIHSSRCTSYSHGFLGIYNAPATATVPSVSTAPDAPATAPVPVLVTMPSTGSSMGPPTVAVPQIVFDLPQTHQDSRHPEVAQRGTVRRSGKIVQNRHSQAQLYSIPPALCRKIAAAVNARIVTSP